MSSFDKDMTRRQALVGAGVLGAGLLAGCGGGNGSTAKKAAAVVPVSQRRKGGVLRIAGAGSGSSETLDPVSYTSGNINNCRFIAIYNRLVRMGPNFTPELELAESFEPNADATQWTIRLHDGIEWHDGKPFGAKDVLYSFNRLNDPKFPNFVSSAVRFANFKGAKLLDNRTLRVPMHEPFAGFRSALVSGFWVVQDGMKHFNKTAIGTGPYKVQSFSPGEVCVVVPNENYWGPVGPFLDRMDLRSIPDTQARLNAYRAGDIDVAMDLGSQAPRLTAGLPGHLVVSPELTSFYFYMDQSKKPFDDQRVVEAFKLAADRKAINDAIQGGKGVIGKDVAYVAPGEEGYPKSWPVPSYDPAKAKKLLADAGYPNGISVTLQAISDYPDNVNLAQLYAQQAKAAGIKVKVNTTPEDKYWSDVFGKADFVSSYGGPNPTDQVLSQWVSNSPNNGTHFRNPAFDKAYNQLQRTTSESQRQPILAKLMDDLKSDSTLNALWLNGYDLVADKVQGWKPAASLWARQDMAGLAVSS
jgi:peptide/nickel transport system substrate-binding protein